MGQSFNKLISFLKLLHDDRFVGGSLAISMNYSLKSEICLVLYNNKKIISCYNISEKYSIKKEQ